MSRRGWEIRKAILDQERAQYLLSGDLTNCPTLFHTYRTRLFRVFRPHASLNHTQRYGDYLQKALHVPMNKTHQDLFKQTFKEIDKRYRNRTYLTELEAKFVWRRMVWAFYRLQKEINPKDSKVLGLNIRAVRGFSEFGRGPWSEHPELRTTVFRPGTFNYKTAERKWFFHGNMMVLGAVQIAKNETLVRLAGVGTGAADYKFPVKFDGLKEYLSEYPQLDVHPRRRKINIYSYSW